MNDTTNIEFILTGILIQQSKTNFFLSKLVKEEDFNKKEEEIIKKIDEQDSILIKKIRKYNTEMKKMEKDPMGYIFGFNK